MNDFDRDYINLVQNIVKNGVKQGDRTGAGRINITSSTLSFDMTKGFPLFQCKFTPFKNIIRELLWFMSGDTNIKPLLDKKVNIWTDDSYNYYVRLYNKYADNNLPLLSKEGFVKAIKEGNNDKVFEDIDYNYGDLGKVYGHYWYTQLPEVINQIKTNPNSARHRVDCWSPNEQSNLDCALPPCHYGFQFICVGDKGLSMVFNMRSTDTMLGLSYNVASYGALLCLIAKITNRVPVELVFQGVNTHIYANHIESYNQLLSQKDKTVNSYPKLEIDLTKNGESMFVLSNYKPNDKVFAPLNT